jgi:hypothetical protein
MISEKVKIKVENISKKIIETNNFFISAISGVLTKNHFEVLLNNYAFVIAHTPICMHLASLNSTDKYMEDFFDKKNIDEAGHVEWAYDDLSYLGKTKRKVDLLKILNNAKLLIDYIIENIKIDVRTYILYIFIAEYLMVLLGPFIVYNTNSSSVEFSVVKNHVELDKNHVLEDLIAIDKCFTENDWFYVESIIDKFSFYINNFYNEILSI